MKPVYIIAICGVTPGDVSAMTRDGRWLHPDHPGVMRFYFHHAAERARALWCPSVPHARAMVHEVAA